MRGVHDRSFMALWHRLLSATNPGAGSDSWRVDDVCWTRHRHSYWGDDYSFQIESHALELGDNHRPAWTLWVVIERWWGRSRKDAVRSTEWSRVTQGNAKLVVRWVQDQAKKRGFE
jgi:hypothetical protein